MPLVGALSRTILLNMDKLAKFQHPASAVAWDAAYSGSNYDTFIWGLQKVRVREVLARLRSCKSNVEHLDFACGTGRVMVGVDDLVSNSVGVDISRAMLESAQTKLPEAEFRHGDIIKNPELMSGEYDLITAFRFFLNADPGIRERIMAVLRLHLRDEQSRLIFNLHGNSTSYLGLKERLAPWTIQPNEHTMTYAEVLRLVQAAGLEIEEWCGFGLLPLRRLHSTPLAHVLRRFDEWASHKPWLRIFSADLLFVCRTSTPSPLLS